MKIGQSRFRQSNVTVWGIVFALPALGYILLFQLYPILFSFYISLHDYDLLSDPVYVGFKHFAALPHDRAFMSSLWITIAYVAYTVVPVLGLSFVMAWALTQVRTSRRLWRTLLFIPSVMPIVSVALVWKLIFNFNGPMNDAVTSLGGSPIPWLNNSNYAPIALVIMSWWHAASYYMIIFLAGFLAIPRDYYEAASIDGARGFQVLRYITLPAMKPTIALAVVLSTVNGLKTFAFQQIVTDGGPANSTQIMTLLIYKTSFSYLDMGRASAYSVVLFGGILLVSLVQIWLLRDRNA
ncbi:carbohydrate ABC transporter permease [Shinella zoogloeoides]|uniref:carbohydrate ABC transporter permease n=1 Tax=Shinella zoogloeoides TaxID=352475 RepID=UPI000E650E10|nr:sugar ABC transporter permease [Shinella zoogloeoides]WPE22836.1 Lactose transport system permease protein LacF [Shinella zoogloeoides]